MERIDHELHGKYTVALTLGLIVFFVSGNQAAGSPRTLSLFPYLFAVLPFSVVLYVLLRQKAREGGSLPMRRGLRMGEAVVRRSALLFTGFVLVYSYFYFEHQPLQLAGIASFMTLLVTWTAGVVFAALCAWVVGTRAAGDETLPAA